MASPYILGHTYGTCDPDVTFEASEIESKSGLVYGCMYHSMGGYVGPASRLPNGGVSADKESPWDVLLTVGPIADPQ